MAGVAPVIGAVYSLGEDDYRYGTGALLVRVTKIGREVEYDGEGWWEVEAMAKPPVTVGVAYPRTLYVRAGALNVPGRA